MDEISILPGDITGFDLIIRICTGIHDLAGQEKVMGFKENLWYPQEDLADDESYPH
jgi:hypothetical protein